VTRRDYNRLPAVERDRRADYLAGPDGRYRAALVVLRARQRRGAFVHVALVYDVARFQCQAQDRIASRDDQPNTRRRWRKREPHTPAAVRRPE
jgi:hypothetical protein